jgi:L-alanine-DL-glutamate epimerase-like enolase superfamily enzyme
MYDHSAPRDMMDPASCREWAHKVRSDPAGFTAHKFGFARSDPRSDPARDRSNRVLTTAELIRIRKGFENCREAIGWDHDIMVHCHWEYDLRTSIQIAEAVEPIRPLWLEDPMPPEYSESWRRLVSSAKVPICTGENLVRRQGFKDFIAHQGCDILHPDLRNTGGFLEAKRIADFAEVYALPMATHNTGSMVATWADAHWAAAVRDFLACETVVGQGGWMDEVVLHDGPVIRDGFITPGHRPGLGLELNADVVKAHLAPGESYWPA